MLVTGKGVWRLSRPPPRGTPRSPPLLRFVLWQWSANSTVGLVTNEVLAQGVKDLLDDGGGVQEARQAETLRNCDGRHVTSVGYAVGSGHRRCEKSAYRTLSASPGLRRESRNAGLSSRYRRARVGERELPY
jgi:hypothetical protein